jgi:hypothetical protein
LPLAEIPDCFSSHYRFISPHYFAFGFFFDITASMLSLRLPKADTPVFGLMFSTFSPMSSLVLLSFLMLMMPFLQDYYSAFLRFSDYFALQPLADAAGFFTLLPAFAISMPIFSALFAE